MVLMSHTPLWLRSKMYSFSCRIRNKVVQCVYNGSFPHPEFVNNDKKFSHSDPASSDVLDS